MIQFCGTVSLLEVLIHTFASASHLARFASIGPSIGLFIVAGSVGLLLLGSLRMRHRTRHMNTKPVDRLPLSNIGSIEVAEVMGMK